MNCVFDNVLNTIRFKHELESECELWIAEHCAEGDVSSERFETMPLDYAEWLSYPVTK